MGAPPAVARAVFGDRLPLAERYAALLADTGVSHGLIGPREVARLWERHVLNCAVVADVFPQEASVVDVGSGAGLPGLVLAIARPDLRLRLVEPMQRRTAWLEVAVSDLGLDNTEVHRGRAEEVADVSAPFVTARAVARLAKLARWSLPLLSPSGTLVAMKGRSAAAELAEETSALRRLGLSEATVCVHGDGLLDEPTHTVQLRFDARPRPPSTRGARRAR